MLHHGISLTKQFANLWLKAFFHLKTALSANLLFSLGERALRKFWETYNLYIPLNTSWADPCAKNKQQLAQEESFSEMVGACLTLNQNLS